MLLDGGLKHGAYGKDGMSLETLKANPHGVDLGPLQPCLEQRLQTEDGMIHIAPQLYLDDLKRLNDSGLLEAVKNSDYPFAMISRRLPRSHNTWTQNSHRLVKGKDPCTLQINPTDAQRLGLENGKTVVVSSPAGSIQLPVEIDDDMFAGVVSIPQGWGHNRQDTAMNVAHTQPGVSINDVTDSQRVDELTGNAAFNGTRVAVAAA
jgi:anaerobic selenocysteine-containing dehydrogenase